MVPIYNIEKTYLENAQKGPFFSEKPPKRLFPPETEWIDLLGFKLASPIGVPAGPLLTSSWIKLAAELGFDLVTYKTIRSKQHPAHPLPNMIFVDVEHPSAKKREKPSILEDLAVTNSFGMPSMSPEFLMEDIPRAESYLKPGQAMIVSVVGTPRPDVDFCQDFVQAALLAKTAGAKLIEANFSCPNVAKREGSLYTTPDTVFEIAQALKKALKETPLILKMGIFQNTRLMHDVFLAAARAGADAICGINSVSMPVVNAQNEPALGQERPTSGICGGPIREDALRFLEQGHDIIHKEKLPLVLMGCGGITHESHFDLFLKAGAQAALCATGMIWNPYLALQYHEKKNKNEKK